jgi:hypothetical protein
MMTGTTLLCGHCGRPGTLLSYAGGFFHKECMQSPYVMPDVVVPQGGQSLTEADIRRVVTEVLDAKVDKMCNALIQALNEKLAEMKKR